MTEVVQRWKLLHCNDPGREHGVFNQGGGSEYRREWSSSGYL